MLHLFNLDLRTKQLTLTPGRHNIDKQISLSHDTRENEVVGVNKLVWHNYFLMLNVVFCVC